MASQSNDDDILERLVALNAERTGEEKGGTSSMTTATSAFVGIWFFAAATNMWIGVTRAGYTILEELPMLFLIFLLPVAVAIFVKWKFL